MNDYLDRNSYYNRIHMNNLHFKNSLKTVIIIKFYLTDVNKNK